MMDRNCRILLHHAMVELKAASTNIGDILPSASLGTEAFLELVEIRQELDTLIKRVMKIKKGGEA